MNYISKLQAENLELKNKLAKVGAEINEFVSFLHSAKFTGTESNGERKDWIATGDVIRRIKEIARGW